MSSPITKLRVFVASPSDVSEERERARNVIENLNKVLCDKLNLYCQFVGWEDVPPGVGSDPQAVINDFIGDNYDIFVCVMWSRIGTATPRAISGSVEEFETAYEKLIGDKKAIKLLFYFKEGPVSPASIDPDQLKAVQKFRSSIASQRGVFYKSFQTADEFENLLNLHLTEELSEWGKSWGVRSLPPEAVVDSPGSQLGVLRPTQPLVNARINKDEFEFEEGLFDLIEIADSNAKLLSQVVERIGEVFERSTVTINEATSEINRPDTESGVEIRRIRRASDKITESLILSSNLLTPELPLFSEYCEKFFESSSKFLILLRAYPAITSNTVLTTWSQIQFLESNMASFHQNVLMVKKAVQEVPRITKNFDKARIRFVASIDGLNSELSTGLNYVHEIKLGLSKLLLNSQTNDN